MSIQKFRVLSLCMLLHKPTKTQIWIVTVVLLTICLRGILDPAGEGTTIIRNVYNCLPVDWYAFTSRTAWMFNSHIFFYILYQYSQNGNTAFSWPNICSTLQPNIIMTVNSFRNISVFIRVTENWYIFGKLECPACKSHLCGAIIYLDHHMFGLSDFTFL